MKTAAAINLFDGTIETKELSTSKTKEPVNLLYSGDTLKHLTSSNRVVNDKFIYTIANKTDTSITLLRSSLLVRYFTADTILATVDHVACKRCHYSNYKLVRIEFNQYSLSKDSITKTTHRYLKDFSEAPSIKDSREYFSQAARIPDDISYYPSEYKWAISKLLVH